VESQTEKKVKKTAKKKVPKSGRGSGGLAVIASSTGGPRALQSVIPYFPKDFPLPVSRCPAYAGRIYEVISSSLE